MGVMFDIIGSIMVRTAIVLIVLRMNVSLNTMVSQTAIHASIQQGVSILRDVMTSDFDRAGLNVSPGTAFITANSSEIKFSGDIDATPNGSAETVRYYLGGTDELENTTNPDDRKLYRQINGGTPLNVANGVVKCVFKYYDYNGSITGSLSNIKSFSISLTLQDGSAIEGRYPSTYWEQWFFPANL